MAPMAVPRKRWTRGVPDGANVVVLSVIKQILEEFLFFEQKRTLAALGF